MPTVGIIGTFDTKGSEFGYLQRCIRELGVETVTIDCGLGQPLLAADISAEAVAHAAGLSFTDLRERRDRGEWVAAMAQGAAVLSAQLYREGQIQALVSLGGSAGQPSGRRQCVPCLWEPRS